MLVRKIAPWLIAVLLFAGFQVLAIRGTVALPFPGIQKSLPQSCFSEGAQLNAGCACTAENVLAIGFPFRTNTYDACRQADTKIWWIMALDFAIQLIIVIIVFLGVKKLLTSHRF